MITALLFHLEAPKGAVLFGEEASHSQAFFAGLLLGFFTTGSFAAFLGGLFSCRLSRRFFRAAGLFAAEFLAAGFLAVGFFAAFFAAGFFVAFSAAGSFGLAAGFLGLAAGFFFGFFSFFFSLGNSPEPEAPTPLVCSSFPPAAPLFKAIFK